MKKCKTWLMTAVMAFAVMIASAVPAFAEDDKSLLDEIKERGVLVVGTSPDFPPSEFIDPSKTGQDQYVGSDMELARYIAEKLGVELQIEASSFDTVLANISTGQIDLAITGLAYTPARAESMEMSIGYNVDEESESSGHGILIRAEDAETYTSFEALDGAKIAAQTGSLQEMFTKDQLPNCEIQSISSIDDGVALLKNGTVDGVASAWTTGNQYVTNNPELAMMEQKFDNTEEYAGTRVGAPKGETELIEAVNDILEEVNELGLYEQWSDEAIELNNSLTSVDSSGGFFSTCVQIVQEYWGLLLQGLLITLGLAAVTVLFGTLIGSVVAFLYLLKNPITHFICTAYVEVLRGTPLLLQLWLFITVFSTLTGGEMPMLVSVIIALIINSSAYVAEIIRSGLQSVDKGQTTMLKIIMPQAVKNILPALGNEFISMVKETSLASTFFIGELMTVNSVIKSAIYKSIEPLVIVGIIYFIVTFTLSKFVKYIERRMSVSD